MQRIIMDFVIWREKNLSLMAHLVCMFVVKKDVLSVLCANAVRR